MNASETSDELPDEITALKRLLASRDEMIARLIAEIARVAHHDALRNQDYVSHAFYAQAAYRLIAFPSWKPYFRFEKLLTATAEPVLDHQDLRLTTMGVRYELTGYGALTEIGRAHG